MEFGICLHSVIPVRREPAHAAEMVSQVLFGEQYRIVEKENSWLRIQLDFDKYEGWIHLLQSQFIPETEFSRLSDSETYFAIDIVQRIKSETRQTTIPIVMGSSLPGYEKNRLIVGQEVFYYDGSTSGSALRVPNANMADSRKTSQQIAEDSILYLNAPYLWGGRSPFGIDCSGFVQMVYKLNNIELLRDAGQQATQGEVISLLAEAESGDLAFFDDEEGKITHVGILIDRSRIIHCSGKVRIDVLDHQGIYDETAQRYTHKLRLIKRVLK